MKIFKKSFFLFIFLHLCHSVYAQETFVVKEDFKKTSFNNYIKVYSTLDSINPDILVRDKSINWKENKVSYGFSNEYYWLKFSIKNTSLKFKTLYLEVVNPHIRFVEFYEFENEQLNLKFRSGRLLPFDKRPVDNVNFVFPIHLEKLTTKFFYVKVDKRTSSVSFPTNLWTQKEFIKVNNKTNLFYGLLFGGFLLIIFYALLVYAYLRKRLYLRYVMYIIFMGLYLFTSIGYTFQYLHRGVGVFNSVIRIVALAFMVFFHIKFLQSLFKTKLHIKKIHFSMNFLGYSLLLIILGRFIFPTFYATHSSLYLKAMYVLILLSICSFFIAALFTYKKHKKHVQLYLVSFSALLVGAAIVIISEYGLFDNLSLGITPVILGSLVEILILSFVLINETKLIFKEKNELTLRIAEKQQEVSKAYIEGIEIEKQRISEELHDNVGSQLANLSRYVSHHKKASSETLEKLNIIIDDVRKISHKLSLKKGNLLTYNEQIQNLIDETFIDDKKNCELYVFGDSGVLNKNQQLNIFRILQEFLQNIQKHSKATHIEIQFMYLENELTITIEDNGIGFNVNKNSNGIGLLNLKRRVDYLNGKLEISSILEKGTFIVVTIPQ